MTKKKIKPTFKYLVICLSLGALFIEILNIIVTWSLGMAQQDVCPKSHFPSSFSIFLGLLSLGIAGIAMLLAKNKPLAIFVFGVWLIVVLGVGYYLQFVSVGGLDWCAFLGK